MINGHQTQTAQRRWFVVVLQCILAISCTGCLTRLGRGHSSLSPRMSAVDTPQSTFRSQDGVLPEPWITPQTSGIRSGYAGLGSPAVQQSTTETTASADTANPPNVTTRARLLKPKFNPVPIQSGSAVRHQPTNVQQPLGHSIVPPAEQLRALINQTSVQPPSGGSVQRDQNSAWPAPDSNAAIYENTTSAALTQPGTFPNTSKFPLAGGDPQRSAALSDPSPQSDGGIDVHSATFEGAERPIQEAGVSDINPSSEPSVLDRLKGLYDTPRDSEGRNLWQRQIQKLQSPWSVFRDRGEREPATTVGGVSQTPMTVERPEPTEAQPLISDTPTADYLLPLLIESLRRDVENWPRESDRSLASVAEYRRRQQDLRLLYLIADEPGSAISAVDSLSDQEQDFWQELMLAMAQYRNMEQEITDQERLTGTVGQLLSAVQHIRPLTALTIQRFEICSRIMSFGRVETFPSNDFDPGQPILLYVELENFGSERTEAGTYRTSMDAELAIFQDGNSEPIETTDLPNVSDESTSVRRDYFQSFELNLPSHLATGKYSIRLRLHDRVTGRLAENVIEFQVR